MNLSMHGTTDRRSCFGPPIDTTTWTLDDLESNRDAVRDLYAQWQEELHTSKSIGIGSTSPSCSPFRQFSV
ncbi:MAG: hypothetical protein VB878_11895 [Pirellulaceae bacterium]